MKRILLPTDFSEKALHALKVASNLAKKHQATLYLLHIIKKSYTINSTKNNSAIPEAMYHMEMAHKKFKILRNKSFMKDMNVVELIEFHDNFDGVLHSSKNHDIDLIIMGSKGAHGLKEIFVGSNTERVVRNSEVPVLVIKDNSSKIDIENFVYACEFTPEYRSSFVRAMKFAKTFNAQVHLVYINTPGKFKSSLIVKSRINKMARAIGLEKYTIEIHNDRSIEKGILNFARSIKADLIGMSTHGRKGLAHLMNGSISEDLVNHSKRPVITFKM